MPVPCSRPIRGNLPPEPTKPRAVKHAPTAANPVKVARRVKMLEMQRGGASVYAVAKHFNLSMDETKYQLGVARREAGIPKLVRSPETMAAVLLRQRRAKIAELLDLGVNWSRIREEVNVGWEMVSEVAEEMARGGKVRLEAVAVTPARVSPTMQVLSGRIPKCSLPKCNVLFQRTRPDQMLCGKHERHAAAIKERAKEDEIFARMRAGKLRL